LSPESLQYGLCVCAERLAILKLTKTSIHNGSCINLGEFEALFVV